MNSSCLTSPDRPDLITLELGPDCYGVTAITHKQPLTFKPLPAGVSPQAGVCGLIRIGGGTAVPVFDIRTPAGKARRYRLLIATGFHSTEQPVSMAFLIDEARDAARPIQRAPHVATVSHFDRN